MSKNFFQLSGLRVRSVRRVLPIIFLMVALLPTVVEGACGLGGPTPVYISNYFNFGGAGTPESTHIKQSLCPSTGIMVGTRYYEHIVDIDEEHQQAFCAVPDLVSFGASAWVSAPNAFNFFNTDDASTLTKSAICPAGQAMTGTRMYGIYSGADEEHVDALCARVLNASIGTPRWVSAPNATSALTGGYKEALCPAGEVMVGTRYVQDIYSGTRTNRDGNIISYTVRTGEHTDAYCAPITFFCPAGGGTITVTSNIPAAVYWITGPVTRSGMSNLSTPPTYSNMTPGVYTITWNIMGNYVTPPSQTFTLTEGGTITFSGTYTQPLGGNISSTNSWCDGSYVMVEGDAWDNSKSPNYIGPWVQVKIAPDFYTSVYDYEVNGGYSPGIINCRVGMAGNTSYQCGSFGMPLGGSGVYAQATVLNAYPGSETGNAYLGEIHINCVAPTSVNLHF